MNVMLLSVSLWAGAATDPNSATRDLFHWLSALRCAALRRLRRAAVLRKRRRRRFAPARSTWTCRSRSASCWRSPCRCRRQRAHERIAYFDSALMLLMFLLAGRLLDAAHAPPHARLRRQSPAILRRATRVKLMRADGGRVETPLRGDQAGRPDAGARRRAVCRSTGASKTGAPRSTRASSPARPGVGSSSSRRARLCRSDQSDRRARASGRRRRERARCSTRSSGLLDKAVEQRRPTCASPTARRGSMCRSSTWPRWRRSSAGSSLGAGWQDALIVAITVLIITCPCALAPRGAGGAGRRRGRAVPPRADPQFRRGARASGRGRHGSCSTRPAP